MILAGLQWKSNFDGDCFWRVHVDNSQRTKPGAVLQLICYEIHVPGWI